MAARRLVFEKGAYGQVLAEENAEGGSRAIHERQATAAKTRRLRGNLE